jgi:lysophospholipase L1-like esterase
VAGAKTHDAIVNVGIGEYYVAYGDSITYGADDDVFIDNTSSDGRNSGGGYEPILNDDLTIFMGYPHNVSNEGVPGDTSADGLLNISTVLSRHQNASRFLVEYGTNDANVFLPVPSGLGLGPGDSGYSGSFKDNMQQIIDAIISAGKEVCLAKIPIALADCMTCQPYQDPSQGQKNIMIQEFNAVIDELVMDPSNGINVVPPDFYSYFEINYPTEYATWVHPNGIGYQSMADLWFQALTQ